MVSLQSFIRAEVNRGASPMPKGAETFSAYAIASTKELIPEMESSARLTLSHPMTFESIGEGLRLFEGSALQGLASFRKRCRDNLITCLNSFQGVQPSGPSSIWVGCPDAMPKQSLYPPSRALPHWLTQILSRNQINLQRQKFTLPLDVHSRIRREYLMALQDHTNCLFCSGVHIKNGLTFCEELEKKLAQAREKVAYFPSF
jgi:hypothetical protein